MAKHNLFLGTAAGSVGDVTVYRREGAQVARVRVRDVANPRSTTQSLQRNFLAPVAKFYSPLADMLERSYEGLNKSKSYSAFLKKNIDDARANGWYLPKGSEFYPMPYTLSRGSIQPLPQSIEAVTGGTLGIVAKVGAGFDNTPASFAQSMVDYGYENGDQVTLIVIQKDVDGNYYPTYERFNLDVNSVQTWDDVLTKFMPTTIVVPEGQEANYNALVPINSNEVVAGAIIISRWSNGIWRRSTQKLIVSDAIMAEITSEENFNAVLATYGGSTSTPISDVYLNNATPGTANGEVILRASGGAFDNSNNMYRPSQLAIAYVRSGAQQMTRVLGIRAVRVTDGVEDILPVLIGLNSANIETDPVVQYHFRVVTSAEGEPLVYGATTAVDVHRTGDEAPDYFNAVAGLTVNAADTRAYLISQGVPAAQLDFQ